VCVCVCVSVCVCIYVCGGACASRMLFRDTHSEIQQVCIIYVCTCTYTCVFVFHSYACVCQRVCVCTCVCARVCEIVCLYTQKNELHVTTQVHASVLNAMNDQLISRNCNLGAPFGNSEDNLVALSQSREDIATFLNCESWHTCEGGLTHVTIIGMRHSAYK